MTSLGHNPCQAKFFPENDYEKKKRNTINLTSQSRPRHLKRHRLLKFIPMQRKTLLNIVCKMSAILVWSQLAWEIFSIQWPFLCGSHISHQDNELMSFDINIHIWKIKIRRPNMMTSSNWVFFALLVLCDGNPPVTGFPWQRPVTRSLDIFFDLSMGKRLSKQPSSRWFETPSGSLWRRCNDYQSYHGNLKWHLSGLPDISYYLELSEIQFII